MEISVLFRHPTAMPTVVVRTQMPSLSHLFRIKRNHRVCKAKLQHEEDDDPFFQAAMNRTSLRFVETLRPGIADDHLLMLEHTSKVRCFFEQKPLAGILAFADPLFVDPYIGCLLPPGIEETDMNRGLHEHCLGTKFIDDRLLHVMNANDGLRQVVLLTDGMDTRPYRINWPTSTIIFDVSPDRIFTSSFKKLQDVGAKIPRSCLLLHVPSETSDIQQVLRSKGFNGARPSVWVLQGFPLLTLTSFKDILDAVNNLAMKGCLFFGELPSWLAETENGIKSTTLRWMDKLFISHGLRVEMIEYEEVARNNGKELGADDYKNLLFMAEQLQLSDDQMEIWRREFQRMEEEGDEDGFEEL